MVEVRVVVIPAKAGIQLKKILMHTVHSIVNNEFACAHRISLRWIPAFAGMTPPKGGIYP
jgi:hypothetical protein